MSSVTFVKNAVAVAQSVGSVLKGRRAAFGLSLEEIEAALTISKKNIAALEDDRFEDIPEELYRDLFLKNYATYLGFDWDEVNARYRAQTKVFHPTLERTNPMPKAAVSHTALWVPSRMMKNSAIIVSITACAAYLLFLAVTMVIPPRLDVISPQENLSVRGGHVLVEGSTDPLVASVIINGFSVPKNQDGSFHQDVSLSEGANTIRISAAKKYGGPSVVERTVFFRNADVSMK